MRCSRPLVLVTEPLALFIAGFGPVVAVGVEGTGSYGAALTRHLAETRFRVEKVNRPNRQERRLHGKSDPLDAYQAAHAVLAGRGTSTPKFRDGYVGALRVLRTARTSAIKSRTAVLTQISGILVSAPEDLRAKYRDLTGPARLKLMTASRPTVHISDPSNTTAIALRRRARRHHYLTVEIGECDGELAQIIADHAPALTQITGIGTAVASQLLVTLGDNPERCRKRSTIRCLDRRRTNSRVIRKDHQTPAQPRRRPRRELRDPSHRVGADVDRPTNQGLRDPADPRRQEQT